MTNKEKLTNQQFAELWSGSFRGGTSTPLIREKSDPQTIQRETSEEDADSNGQKLTQQQIPEPQTDQEPTSLRDINSGSYRN